MFNVATFYFSNKNEELGRYYMIKSANKKYADAIRYCKEKNIPLIKKNLFNISERLSRNFQTNNRAEIFAVIRAIETSIEKDKCLLIYIDSIYIINCYRTKNLKRTLIQ